MSLDEALVVAKCVAAKVGISNVESLPTGGVRLVCMSSDGAEQMRKKLKRALINGEVARGPYRPGSPPLQLR